MKRMSSICVFVVLSLSVSACSQSPSVRDAEAYWRKLINNSNGLIRFTSFSKTDGKSTPNGYTLYYSVIYEFTDNCQYDFNFHAEKSLPQGLDLFATMGTGQSIGNKGQQLLQSGEMWYEKRESGWRLVAVENAKVSESPDSKRQRTAEAEKQKKAAIELNSGKELHQAGNVKEAISQYEKVIANNPSLVDAEFFLGLAWSDLGDLDQAIEHYERCLVLNPKDGKCESNLAGILVSKGRRAEARSRYEHSLSVNPDLQIAHKELADILCGDGEYDSAIAHYEEALRIQPDFKEAKQNLTFARTLAGH